ncbi:MAG TPA: phospholipase D-like domain-containing protein [Steroidobacteraceae bacterium]|jgi:cardiolipin synthase
MMSPEAVAVNLARRGGWPGSLSVLTLLATGVAGCAHIPQVPEPVATSTAAEIQVQGARGALSPRSTAAVLKRLAAQAPDTGALQRHLVIEQSIAGSPLYTGNHITVLRDGPATFAATFGAMRQARHYLYLEYYIFEEVSCDGEQLSDLLIARHQQGVQIDVMYDGIGSMSTPAALFERLRSAGIRVREFNPIRSSPLSINDRDHRKILIADGQQALIGGVNLSRDYERGSGSGPSDSDADESRAAKPAAAQEPWHDVDLQIDGPAVSELKHLFEQHWLSQGGEREELAADDGTPGARGDEVVRILGSIGGQLTPHYYATLISAIRSAATHVWVTASYFVPTHQEHRALKRAARAGVDVRLLLPSHSDSAPALAAQQSHYADLLASGVKIYERDDGILHSKTVVVDGVWSIVGSSNFDHRSVLFNDEVDAVVISGTTGTQLEQYFQQDLQHATAIDREQWQHRAFTRKLRERFWRLWEQWL